MAPAPQTGAAPSSQPTPARNPMVVEVPRYRIIESPPAAPGAGSGGDNASATNAASTGSGRGGPEGAASGKSGSLLGLGAASPMPLPSASAPAAPTKQLNLSLPRVDVYRSGIGPVRQPNLSDMANAQLRRGPAKDPMAEAVNNSEKQDCLKDAGMGLLGAPVAAYKAMTDKCK